MIVNKTNDYNMFSFIDGNRNINEGQLTRLTKSIENNYIPIPIVVNEKKQIIDGQHRYTVVKSLNKPVYYIEIAGLRLAEVHTLNTIAKNWNHDDYMNSYADKGVVAYIKYREFKSKYNFSHNDSLALLCGMRVGGNLWQQFKEGLLTITSYSNAVNKADKITMIKEYYDGYRRRTFIYAMMRVFINKDYNHTEILKKLSYQSTKLVDCTKASEYLALIEEIYNYKRKNKVRLY